MKGKKLLALACVLLLALPSVALAGEGLGLSLFEWAAQPLADQPGATPEALAQAEAWAARYADTDFEALFLQARAGKEFSGNGYTSEGISAEAITGPFFEVCATGGDMLYRAEEEYHTARALESGEAYLRLHVPDAVVAAHEKAPRLFSLEHFQVIAEQDAPAQFCVLESVGYSGVGQYSFLEETEPQWVSQYKYRVYVIDADTGEVVSWRLYEPPFMVETPESVTVHRDMNGRYVTDLEHEDPWAKFFSTLTYTDALYVDGQRTAVDMHAAVIVLPEGLTEIGENAFIRNTTLTSITIPEGVVRIGPYAFAECTALREVILPESLVEIGEGAFEKCTSLESITLPSGLTEISDSLLYWALNLKSVNLPAGIKRIGDHAFSCTALEEVTFPDGLESIGNNAYSVVDELQSVVVPGSVKSVGRAAFEKCEALTSIVFEEGVEYVGREFCYESRALTDITFPSTLTIPPDEAERFWDTIPHWTGILELHYPEDSAVAESYRKWW